LLFKGLNHRSQRRSFTGRAFDAIVNGTPSHGLDAWYDSRPWGQRPSEEACAGKPQAGFCEGEAHNGAWSNIVTLPTPKGGSNREYKADLHTGGVLSTRPPGGLLRGCMVGE